MHSYPKFATSNVIDLYFHMSVLQYYDGAQREGELSTSTKFQLGAFRRRGFPLHSLPGFSEGVFAISCPILEVLALRSDAKDQQLTLGITGPIGTVFLGRAYQ